MPAAGLKITGGHALLKPASLAVKCLLELAAFAALAYWGPVPGAAREPPRWPSLRRWRLPAPARVPLELTVFGPAVFGLAAGGLAAAGGSPWPSFSASW